MGWTVAACMPCIGRGLTGDIDVTQEPQTLTNDGCLHTGALPALHLLS